MNRRVVMAFGLLVCIQMQGMQKAGCAGPALCQVRKYGECFSRDISFQTLMAALQLAEDRTDKKEHDRLSIHFRLELAKACYKNNCDEVEQLLQQRAYTSGSGVRRKKDLGYDQLFIAKSIEIARLLMQEEGIKKRSDWDSVIHRATWANYPPELLKYYIDNAGIDINDRIINRDWKEQTPLHLWARWSMDDGVARSKHFLSAQAKLKILINAGANTLLVDDKGLTALDHLKNTKKYWTHFKNLDPILDEAYDVLILLLSVPYKQQKKQQTQIQVKSIFDNELPFPARPEDFS